MKIAAPVLPLGCSTATLPEKTSQVIYFPSPGQSGQGGGKKESRNRCVNSNSVCSPGLMAPSGGWVISEKSHKQILNRENPIGAL